MSRAIEIVNWITLGLEPRPLINAGKEACSPVSGGSFRETTIERVGHDNEGGKVAALTAEAISDPGTEARISHPREAGVHHEEGRAVVVGLGVAGVDESHFINVFTKLGKNG
jgi:hypothetical protein